MKQTKERMTACQIYVPNSAWVTLKANKPVEITSMAKYVTSILVDHADKLRTDPDVQKNMYGISTDQYQDVLRRLAVLEGQNGIESPPEPEPEVEVLTPEPLDLATVNLDDVPTAQLKQIAAAEGITVKTRKALLRRLGEAQELLRQGEPEEEVEGEKQLVDHTVAQLRAIARDLDVSQSGKKADIIARIEKARAPAPAKPAKRTTKPKVKPAEKKKKKGRKVVVPTFD